MSKDSLERIAIALEEQNKVLKKIHVALNGISGKLTEGKRSIDNVEKAINSLGERLPFVSSAICESIDEILIDKESLDDLNANLLDISSSIKDELGNVLVDINRTLDGRLSDISSK